MVRLWVPMLVAAALCPSEMARAQSTEDDVVQVVVALFDAMRAGDRAGLEAVFFEGARLSGPGTDDGSGFSLRETPVDGFIDGVVAASRQAVLDERIYDPEVRISGRLATVWVEYDLYRGDEFSHCGVDAFQLAHDGTSWRIFQIADTRQTEGCPER